MLCKVYIEAVNWQVWLENILLWFPWWNVKCGARCSHVFGEHIHPHLNSPLKPLNTRTQSFKRIQTKTLQHKGSFKGVVGSVEYDWLTYLFDSWFVRVEQWSGFHVFRDKFAADLWDFIPVLQHGQSQMFIGLLLQTWKGSSNNTSGLILV